MLNIDIAVTSMPVAGPKIIRLAREMPKLTETLPVFGSGADKLSAANINIPNIITPNKEIFLYSRSIYINEETPAMNIIKT